MHMDAPLPAAEKSISAPSNLPDSFASAEGVTRFFSNPKNAPAWRVSYKEFLAIFGKSAFQSSQPKVNRYLLRTHCDYYNYCYDDAWAYK